jgi:transposase
MVFAVINTLYEYFCGIDLHSRSMFVTVMNKAGEILFRRDMPNDFKVFLKYMQPYLGSLAVGVESTYNWYWLADGCRQAKIPFYLGHALYMKAITGGKKKNDRIDSKTIADLMRSNMFPMAYAYPKEMRATRDLLRRRRRLVNLRAEAYTHIQLIFAQQGILDIDADDVKRKKTRHTLVEKFAQPDLKMTIESDLNVVEAFDPIIAKLERQIRAQAKHHDRKAFELLQTVPGIGEMLALTILYEMHSVARFESPQQFSSYGRVVKCERTSGGKITGGGNQKIGNPCLKWALGEIIIHAKAFSPRIKRYYEQLQAKFGKRAKSIIAHQFAIAIYYMLKNGKVFDEVRFVQARMK